MMTAAITHEQNETYCSTVSEKELTLKVRAARDDLKSISIRYWNSIDRNLLDDYGRMKKRSHDRVFDYFTFSLIAKEKLRYIDYYFILEDLNKNIRYLSQTGIDQDEPESSFFRFQYYSSSRQPNLPSWAIGALFYQIFPDRFHTSTEKGMTVENGLWKETPSRRNFMGGDLIGIKEKVDYMKDLGISILYINPIFHSPSNHKYDTIDYYKIDPSFGSTEDLISLVKKCHSVGIHVLLDGVFNHCSVYFRPFQDLIKNGHKSQYCDWFYIYRFPVEIDESCYETTGYYKWMPKFNLENPHVRAYLIEAAVFWTKTADIDGWRIDLADEIDHTFLIEFRKAIKSIKPQALLLGETWTDARNLLTGDQMDSVMNYRLYDIILDFFIHDRLSVTDFDSRLITLLNSYPTQINAGLFNFLDTHDTERFMTSCGGNKQLYKCAAAFLIMFPGSPSIFYGDEIGLDGSNDPSCRKGMIWNPEYQDRDIFAWYKILITIRTQNKSVQNGEFMVNLCDERGIFGFFRSLNREHIYAVINKTDHAYRCSIPILEAEGVIEELIEQKAYHITPLHAETVNSFYNSDITSYKGILSADIPAYGVKIFRGESEEVQI